MSRWYGGEDWDYARQCLWDNAVRRATVSPRGQKALRALEAALLALPSPRLIEGALCDGSDFCAVGAMAAHRMVLEGKSWEDAIARLRWNDDDSVDETARFAEQELKMSFALAWDMAFENDHPLADLTPERRYEVMLAWVRARLLPQAVA